MNNATATKSSAIIDAFAAPVAAQRVRAWEKIGAASNGYLAVVVDTFAGTGCENMEGLATLARGELARRASL